MRILFNSFYNQAFKAHSYKVNPKTSQFSIQTDNNPKLGEEPYLVYKTGNSSYDKASMEKEGSVYTCPVYIGFMTPEENISYHIEYKDTNCVDKKDVKDYSVNPAYLIQQALIETRNRYRQPLIQTINSGSTVGKILCKSSFSAFESVDDIDEPTIIVADMFHSQLGNPNIVGLILTSFDLGALSHMGTQFRNNTNVCGVLYDPMYVELLKNFNGQNVRLSLSDNKLEVVQTDEKGKPKVYPQISIPEQKTYDRVLSSSEYSTDTVGAKAVNLKRLEELVQSGKIDIKIPKSIALPNSWVQNLFDKNIGQKVFYEKDKERYICKEVAPAFYDNSFESLMQGLIHIMDINGLDVQASNVMVRSAFNGEDLADYSAAGLYKSEMTSITPENLYNSIVDVAQSKWSDEAIHSRKMMNIPDSIIKPTILIQDCITPDYKFTVYTNFDNQDKMRIEVLSGTYIEASDAISPHVFEYDKKTKELTYKSIQMLSPNVCFDETLQNIELEPILDDLAQRTEVFDLLNKLIQNAIVIENEFGHPQDIEGGFVGNDIYLWQARNIVK